VQYQLPASLCILWQRLGRVARNIMLQGLAIILVEKKYFKDEQARRRERAEIRRMHARKRRHLALLNETSAGRLDTQNIHISGSNSQGLDTLVEESPQDTEHTTSVPDAGCNISAPSKAPPKRSKARSKQEVPGSIEKGLETFVNAHLDPKPERQCRHGAINEYFQNPVGGELFFC
jgi:superfamily II DNA/RNA helicase